MSTATILVVEDNTLNLKTLVHILKKNNFEVLTATTGQDTYKLLSKKIPDLILLDIILPDTSGFDIIENLKANPVTATIPVIFASGKEDTKSKTKAFSLGCVDYISKPYDRQEILARVGVHLKLHATIKQLENTQAETLKQIQGAQHSLLALPKDFPQAHFRILYKSLNAAGGDFYEIIPLDKYRTGYFMGDLSGHDIKTSFLTASIKALLKQNCTPLYNPLESMQVINRVLNQLLKPGQYLTASYYILDRKALQVCYINMGHLPLLHIPAAGIPHYIESEGDILGGFSDAQYEEITFSVKPGDILLSTTDGLIEESLKTIWTAALPTLLNKIKQIQGTGFDHFPQRLFHQFFSKREKPQDDVLIMANKVRSMENLLTAEKPRHLQIEFQGNTKNIDLVVEKASKFIGEKLPKLNLFGFKLCLYEGLNNAWTHGNKESFLLYLKLSICISPKLLKMQIFDEGNGFNWKSGKKHLMPGEKATHGRGIPLLEAYGYKFYYNKWGNVLNLNYTLEP